MGFRPLISREERPAKVVLHRMSKFMILLLVMNQTGGVRAPPRAQPSANNFFELAVSLILTTVNLLFFPLTSWHLYCTACMEPLELESIRLIGKYINNNTKGREAYVVKIVVRELSSWPLA